MHIDKIYIISLTGHLPEEQSRIAENLNTLGLEQSTPYEIVKAFDARNGDIPEGFRAYPNWNLGEDSWNAWWRRPMLPGEIGCAYSHYIVWEKIASSEEERILVLEEDFWGVNPIKNLKTDNLPEWDIAVIGRWPFEEGNEERINSQWLYPKEYYNSHAYIISKEATKKIIAYPNLKQNLIPSDELLVAAMMPHRREDIRNIFPPIIKGIASDVEFVTQKRGQLKSTIEIERPELKPLEDKLKYEVLDISDWDLWKSKYLNHTLSKGEYDLLIDDLGDNILEFPLFTDKFCKDIIALAEQENKWTIDRHEFYPTNDVLLPELGLDEIYNKVIDEVIKPLCVHYWTLEGWNSIESENFMARYTTDRQSHLSLHHDFSHITMVVKLNDEFEGGGTWFPKYNKLSNPKRVGTATLHPGMITHLHGARPIYAGKRYICVSFMRKNN